MPLSASITDRLHNQHLAIAEIISGAELPYLEAELVPNKWSIKDQVAHLAVYQPVFHQRVRRILEEENPAFERYVADTDPEFTRWRTMALPALLQQLDTDRLALHAELVLLTDAELGRTGWHRKFGELTLVQWTEFFLLHEAHHIFSLFQMANDTELRRAFRP